MANTSEAMSREVSSGGPHGVASSRLTDERVSGKVAAYASALALTLAPAATVAQSLQPVEDGSAEVGLVPLEPDEASIQIDEARGPNATFVVSSDKRWVRGRGALNSPAMIRGYCPGPEHGSQVGGGEWKLVTGREGAQQANSGAPAARKSDFDTKRTGDTGAFELNLVFPARPGVQTYQIRCLKVVQGADGAAESVADTEPIWIQLHSLKGYGGGSDGYYGFDVPPELPAYWRRLAARALIGTEGVIDEDQFGPGFILGLSLGNGTLAAELWGDVRGDTVQATDTDGTGREVERTVLSASLAGAYTPELVQRLVKARLALGLGVVRVTDEDLPDGRRVDGETAGQATFVAGLEWEIAPGFSLIMDAKRCENSRNDGAEFWGADLLLSIGSRNR